MSGAISMNLSVTLPVTLLLIGASLAGRPPAAAQGLNEPALALNPASLASPSGQGQQSLPLQSASAGSKRADLADSAVFAKSPSTEPVPLSSAEHRPALRSTQPPIDAVRLAQAQPVDSATLVQQGTQISLNGRTVTAAWSQWQTPQGPRIALSEVALMQLFGVQLLSTAGESQQPVAWFSDPDRQIARLTPRRLGSQRHLEITDLAQQAGWFVEAGQGRLSLATLVSKVRTIRQGKQSWGDRIVFELDAPAPYRVEANSDEFTLELDAQTDLAVAQAFKPQAGNRVRTVQLQPSGNRTSLKLGIPIDLRPQISMLVNPLRLIIDVGNPDLPRREIHWAPGLRWRQQVIQGFPVISLALNPRQPGLKLQPILPNPSDLKGTAPLIQIAQKAEAAAAINGGFFNRNNQFPLGAVRINQIWRSGPILGRGVVAWNDAGEFRFERLTLQETAIVEDERFPLTTLNSAYVQAGIARYTPEWGVTYTTLSDNEIIATVRDGQVVTQSPIAATGTNVPVPANTMLLVFRSNRTAATKFTVGETVQIESNWQPDLNAYPHIVGGGPLLVRQGQIVLDAAAEKFTSAFITEAAPRSGIGRTQTGDLLLVSVQNAPDGKEPTLTHMAQIMQQLGAVDALNLDGGSSTTLYLGGQILDRAPRSSARVHNAIGIIFLP